MTTPKQDLKRLRIIETCHNNIRIKGAHARVIIRMPGTPRGTTRRRLSAKGPRGQIITQTHDQKKILVMFKADQLLTSMEVTRSDNATG